MELTKITMMLMAIALFAAACGGGDEATTTDTSVPAATAAEAEAEAAQQAQAQAQAQAEAEASAEAQPINGQELYEANCARCHGADGIGTRGPDLVEINTNIPDQQESFDQILNGGSGMPSFGARLSEDEVQAMVDYIYATF